MACSILLVRALVEALEHAGVARGDFFRAARFDPARLERHDGRVELDELSALQQLALDLCGDEGLGLRMGELATSTTYSLTAHLVAHASTLRDGIDALMRFHQLLTDQQICELKEDGQSATLRCDIPPGSARFRRFHAEVMLTGFYRMLQHFERLARPTFVAFEYPPPAHRAEYARIFGGVERFDQPFTGIVFSRHLLGASQLHKDAEFHAALRDQAERRVSRLAQSLTHAERVREYVLASTPEGRRNMGAVARGLGTSPRSLRRRLEEEGASYTDVVERALATLAMRFIFDEGRSIEATAYAMGYSVPTAFHRAFKRWTGSTPTEYRTRRLQEGSERPAPIA